MPKSTYTYREPWTAGLDRLANTITQILDARNQREAQKQQAAAMQQQQSMNQLRSGWDMLTKTVQLAGDRNIHPSIKKSALDSFNKLAPQFGISAIPTDIDFNDDSFNEAIKQIGAVKSHVEKGTIGLGDVPNYFNTIIDDAVKKYGAGAKETSTIEDAIKRHTSEIANKRYSEFKDISATPESMAPTPEGQASIVQQMAGNLSQISPQLGAQLEREFGDTRRTQKDFALQEPKYVSQKTGNPVGWNRDEGVFYDTVTRKVVPATDLAPVAFARTSDETSKMLSGIQTATQNIADLKSVIKDFELTGPIRGRYKELASKFADDPRFVDARALKGMIESDILRSQSGLVVSDTERKYYETNILPMMTNPDANFKALVNRVDVWLKRIFNNNVDMLKKQRKLAPDKIKIEQEKEQPSKTGSKKIGRFTVEVE